MGILSLKAVEPKALPPPIEVPGARRIGEEQEVVQEEAGEIWRPHNQVFAPVDHFTEHSGKQAAAQSDTRPP
jgi:hypothetical protein